MTAAASCVCRASSSIAAVILVSLGISALLRNAPQAAVGAENPAVIEALKHAGLAGFLAAYAAAAMGAEIVEDANLPAVVAIEDEIAAGDGAGDERAGLGQFAVVAAIEPAALEDFCLLERCDVSRCKRRPVHSENATGPVLVNQLF